MAPQRGRPAAQHRGVPPDGQGELWATAFQVTTESYKPAFSGVGPYYPMRSKKAVRRAHSWSTVASASLAGPDGVVFASILRAQSIS